MVFQTSNDTDRMGLLTFTSCYNLYNQKYNILNSLFTIFRLDIIHLIYVYYMLSVFFIFWLALRWKIWPPPLLLTLRWNMYFIFNYMFGHRIWSNFESLVFKYFKFPKRNSNHLFGFLTLPLTKGRHSALKLPLWAEFEDFLAFLQEIFPRLWTRNFF